MNRLKLFVLAGGLCVAAASFGAQAPPRNIPTIVPDPSAADWVVDRFAGNSTAGAVFFQGPANEVGGLGRPYGVAVAPDGRVFIRISEGIVEVSTDGILRLIAGQPGGTVEGPADQASVGGSPAWNPKDNHLYFTGPQCIRRLVEKPDGSRYVEVVYGTPGKKGMADGPVKTATFTAPGNLCIDSKGTIYMLDNGRVLRRIKDGQVTTLNRNFRGGGYRDGPLDKAVFKLIGLGGGICLGDDDTLYVADHWNFRVRKIDLKTMTVSTIAGMPKPKQWRRNKQTPLERRYNSNADGPALTHASFNSGCGYVRWDPVHKALWCGGPDENRFRWLAGDGWIRTVIGTKGTRRWNRNGQGIPAAKVRLVWNSVLAVDAQGRAYLAASSDKNGLWRAYNRKEMKK